jgi:osmoprotectant transport system substrate-binding protein
MQVKRTKVVAIATAAALAALTAFTAVAPANAAASKNSLAGVNLVIGSKDFTESIVLSKIVKQYVLAHGGKVTDKTNIKGSVTTRDAMTKGQISLYWEYTGTAWLVYQKQTDTTLDPNTLYKKVAAADKANKVTWLPMTSFNDTYAWAVTKAVATQYGVKTYSDMVTKIPADKRVWCVESEFASRPDGMAGFKKAYNVPASDTIKTLDTGAIYAATQNGQCTIGEVFATDGRIGALGLMVPKEDVHYFPAYNAAITTTDAIAKKYPQLIKALAPISGLISNQTMATLNARIDVLGEDGDTVAKSWLASVGLL